MRLVALLLMSALAACVNAGNGTFEIDGNVSGSPPTTAKVVFVWNATSQAYKWGDGVSTASTWSVALDPRPPVDAQISTTGMAVGLPVLIDNSQTIADGTIMLDSTARLGIATDYAIIWKDASATGLGTSWDAAFGASYSCAQCVRAGNGTFDGWVLTPCANMTIVVGGQTSAGCNWN